MQGGGAALDLEPAGHDALVLAAGQDAVLHDLPDMQQPLASLLRAAPGLLVLGHQLADRKPVLAALGQQLAPTQEWKAQWRAVFDDAVDADRLLVHHEPATHRVILAAAQLQAGAIEGPQDHAVGMVGQGFADHRQVFFFDEADGLLAQQRQRAGAANRCQPVSHTRCIDGVRVLPFQPQQHGLVATMALAGGAE
ncbi:hypothetical protein D3C85_1109230 [compost metagenome]